MPFSRTLPVMADTHRSDITCRLVIVVRIVQFICVTTCVVYSGA